MRTILFTLLIWLIPSYATAQILPEEAQSLDSEKFMVYTEHVDSLNKIHYQVGTYNPKSDPSIIHLPIYLRIVNRGVENYYSLHTKYDPDIFSFPKLPSDRLTVIKGRYEFYIYDLQQKTLSRKLHPGLGQYEGEDAISGLFSGLTLFDNERFIFGHVQGFGIFCYDISHPANPVELIQHTFKKANNDEPVYAFIHKNSDELFAMITAQPDRSSQGNINRLYNRLKNIGFYLQDIVLDLNHAQYPVPSPTLDEYYLPKDYFLKISTLTKHTYTNKTEEFCSNEEYEFKNGIRYLFTDYGPCEQCGHGVTEIYIPNFNISQGFLFTLIFSGYRYQKEIFLEEFSDKEIRFSWDYSDVKIIPQDGGILIIEDVML